MRFLIFVLFIFKVNGAPIYGQELNWDSLLRSTPALEKIFLKSDASQLEIILEVITKDERKSICYQYPNKPNQYFYPASIVKLPTAIFACERVNQMDSIINIHTPLEMIAKGKCQRDLKWDEFNAINKPTLAGLIRKSLTISDNQAYSRLYEWVGPEYYIHRFNELSMPNAVVRKKFDGCSTEQCRCVSEFRFFDDNHLVHVEPARCYEGAFKQPKFEMKVGDRHWSNGKVVNAPMDFSHNNCIELQNIHDLLKALYFPQISQLNLYISEEQRNWIIASMQKSPHELSEVWKNNTSLHQHYYNFFVYGHKPANHQDDIVITNIVGLALGFTIESAVIEDHDGNQIILTAKLYTNQSDVAGSGEYNYEKIAFPFMRDLGKACLEWSRIR